MQLLHLWSIEVDRPLHPASIAHPPGGFRDLPSLPGMGCRSTGGIAIKGNGRGVGGRRAHRGQAWQDAPSPPGPRGPWDIIPSSAGLGSSGPTAQASASQPAWPPAQAHSPVTRLKAQIPEPQTDEHGAKGRGRQATEVRLRPRAPASLTLAWALWPSLWWSEVHTQSCSMSRPE